MRTRMRIAGAPVFVLLLLVPALSSAQMEEAWQWKGPRPDGCRVRVPGASGLVHVIGLEGVDSVEASARMLVVGGKGDGAASLLEQAKIVVSEREGFLTVEISPSRRTAEESRSIWKRLFSFGEEPHLWIDLTVALPAEIPCGVYAEVADVDLRDLKGGAEVEAVRGDVRGSALGGGVSVRATSGHVAVDEIEGDLTVHSTSGEIEVWRVAGALRVSGTSGDMYLYDISGGAEVRGVSGDVLVEECAGSLLIEVGGGDIEVIRCGSDLVARSGKGDILVRAEPSNSALFHLQSAEGDVDLAVSSAMSGKVDATTGSGAIQCFLPIVIERITLRGLVGLAGQGAAWVRIETESGDIRISRTD